LCVNPAELRIRREYTVVRNQARTLKGNAEGIPTVIFFDRKAVVRYVGNREANDYAWQLEELFGEEECPKRLTAVVSQEPSRPCQDFILFYVLDAHGLHRK
jgi:hypothetical protein